MASLRSTGQQVRSAYSSTGERRKRGSTCSCHRLVLVTQPSDRKVQGQAMTPLRLRATLAFATLPRLAPAHPDTIIFPAPAVTSPACPESDKTASSPRDAPGSGG